MFKLCLYQLIIAILAGKSSETPQKINIGQPPKLPPFQPCVYPINIRCWTEWFDIDNPSGTGDWELLALIQKKYPDKICKKPIDIEARTLSGISADESGDIIHKNNPNFGFVCKNKDQCKLRKCKDYRVRFNCHPPFCGSVCWTKWYDRDNPSGSGDWELLKLLKIQFPGQISNFVFYIEAVTTDTLTPAISTGQVFHIYNPSQGFVCRNKDQKQDKCRDYKVRFAFPCEDIYLPYQPFKG